MAEKKNPIEEARRYVANAKETIIKAEYDPEIKLYKDSKYVKTAGNILWNGCIIAIEATLKIKEKGRPSIDKYIEAAAKRDKKLLTFIKEGYTTMHLNMGYDGTKAKKTCEAGFLLANAIIDRCEILNTK